MMFSWMKGSSQKAPKVDKNDQHFSEFLATSNIGALNDLMENSIIIDDVKTIRQLAESGFDFNSKINHQNETPLECAIKYGRFNSLIFIRSVMIINGYIVSDKDILDKIQSNIDRDLFTGMAIQLRQYFSDYLQNEKSKGAKSAQFKK